MRLALVSLVFVLGCVPVVAGGDGGTGGSSDPECVGGAGGFGGDGVGGFGGAGVGGFSGVGGAGVGGFGGAGVGGAGGANPCVHTSCYSEGYIMNQLKPDSTWTPSGDPYTVDCPPVSELMAYEPGVCFASGPIVSGAHCCYEISICCL